MSKSSRPTHWLLEIAIPGLGLIIVLAMIAVWAHNSQAASINFNQVILSLPQCADGIDNDSDGLVDWPDDTDCVSADYNSESSAPPVNLNPGGGSSAPEQVVVSAKFGSVTFVGKAYSNSRVWIEENGIKLTEVLADKNANFSITVSDLSTGSHILGLRARDRKTRDSAVVNYSVEVTEGLVILDQVTASPTVELGSREVHRGALVAVSGESAPYARIELRAYSGEDYDLKILDTAQFQVLGLTTADSNGDYSYQIDTGGLAPGTYKIFAGIQESIPDTNSEPMDLLINPPLALPSDESASISAPLPSIGEGPIQWLNNLLRPRISPPTQSGSITAPQRPEISPSPYQPDSSSPFWYWLLAIALILALTEEFTSIVSLERRMKGAKL